MPTMKRPYQIAGTVLLLFAVYIGRESLGLKYYTTLGPGPGFFPFWLAVMMGLLAATMLFQATFQQSPPRPGDFYASRLGYLRAGAVCLAIIAVVFLMERIGFQWTMAAFFAFLLLSLGNKSPFDLLLVTAVGSLGSFKLFDELLKVPLPRSDFDAPVEFASDVLFGPIGLVLVLAYIFFRFGLYRRISSLGIR
jgi:putative tricarboxylic transport membrane protein